MIKHLNVNMNTVWTSFRIREIHIKLISKYISPFRWLRVWYQNVSVREWWRHSYIFYEFKFLVCLWKLLERIHHSKSIKNIHNSWVEDTLSTSAEIWKNLISTLMDDFKGFMFQWRSNFRYDANNRRIRIKNGTWRYNCTVAISCKA